MLIQSGPSWSITTLTKNPYIEAQIKTYTTKKHYFQQNKILSFASSQMKDWFRVNFFLTVHRGFEQNKMVK
jgi:hypothetical protein